MTRDVKGLGTSFLNMFQRPAHMSVSTGLRERECESIVVNELETNYWTLCATFIPMLAVSYNLPNVTYNVLARVGAPPFASTDRLSPFCRGL